MNSHASRCSPNYHYPLLTSEVLSSKVDQKLIVCLCFICIRVSVEILLVSNPLARAQTDKYKLSNLVKFLDPWYLSEDHMDTQIPSPTGTSTSHHSYTFLQPGRFMSKQLLVNLLISCCSLFDKYLFKESLVSMS